MFWHFDSQAELAEHLEKVLESDLVGDPQEFLDQGFMVFKGRLEPLRVDCKRAIVVHDPKDPAVPKPAAVRKAKGK